MDKNISALLREIKDATGWTEPRIASEIGTSQPTVNRILNGQLDCKGSTLRAIVDLHREVTARTAGAKAQPLDRRATDPEPEPGRAGRTPVSRDRIMTVATEQPVLYERRAAPANPK